MRTIAREDADMVYESLVKTNGVAKEMPYGRGGKCIVINDKAWEYRVYITKGVIEKVESYNRIELREYYVR